LNKAKLIFLLLFCVCLANPVLAKKSETVSHSEDLPDAGVLSQDRSDVGTLDLKKYGFVFHYNPAQWELKASAPTRFDFNFKAGNISASMFTYWTVFPLEYMPESELANFKKYVSSTAKILKSDLSENNGVKIITTEFEMDYKNKPITCISIYSVSDIGAVKLQAFIEADSADIDSIKRSRDQIVQLGRGLAAAAN